MKGLILCAGKGTRLHPLTLSYPKTLLPIANVPILKYCIEKLVEIEIQEIGIVLNASQEKVIKEMVGTGEQWNVRLTYIYQNEPKGIADAVKCAREFIEDSPFCLLLGDNLITESLTDLRKGLEQQGSNASIMLAAVTKPQDYGIAVIRGNRIVGLEEKPKEPKSNLAVLGTYAFDSSIFQAIDAIAPSPRGEYEISDAIQWLIDNDCKVSYSFAVKPIIDVGNIERWLEANRCILEQRNKTSAHFDRCHLHNTQIIPPVIIGQGCEINNSIIGPYVSIGTDVMLEGCTISNSILLTGVKLMNVPYPVRDSIFGPHSVIAGLHIEGR